MDSIYYRQGEEPLFSTDIDKLKKEEKENRDAQLRQWKEDFIDTFCRRPSGRRVLWFLLFETYVFRKHKTGNANAYVIDGKYELGQDIVDIIGPEELLKVLIDVRNDELKKAEEARTEPGVES